MKRKLLLSGAATIFAVILIFSACSRDTTNYIITADKVASAVTAQHKLPELIQLSQKQADNRYAFTDGDVSEFCVYVAQDGAYADEIAVVKMTSADRGSEVENTLKQRVDAINDNFKDYRPQECDKISKAIVYTKGNFTLMVISGSADSIKSSFIKALDDSAAKG